MSESTIQHQIELDTKGMSNIRVEWMPAGKTYEGCPTGAYYCLTLESDGVETTMYISPDQLRAIKKAIDKAIEGDPHLRVFFDWINTYWDDLINDSDPCQDDGDEDSDEEDNGWTPFQEKASEEWHALWRIGDCQDILPPEYCQQLGIPQHSTCSEAKDHISYFISNL